MKIKQHSDEQSMEQRRNQKGREKILRQTKMEPQHMGCSKSSSKSHVYSIKYVHQEKRKISNKQRNFTPQGTRKKEQAKPKVSRRKEVIKIRVEINEIENRKTIKRF